MNKYLITFLTLSIFGCSKSDSTSSENLGSPIFEILKPEETNVNFQNTLEEGPNTNILMYEYFYNGGGVATGDFNADGLVDIYFTSNMGENKLYKNLGNLKFEDITTQSKTAGRPGPWKTGVNVVDINADGKLDFYLCYSGALPAEKRKNELYVNQGNDAAGNPIFEEQAATFGLDHNGYSNQAYFFDYDKDGDLDMLLLNHNPKNLPLLNETATAALFATDNPEMGLRLLSQNNGKFTDITQKAGINGSELSYGLGIGISDINEDGWPDFYVSNDYAVPDYLYINQKNGAFQNKISSMIGHTSQFSMGNDIADINNDGSSDIFTLDMLPEDNKRQKLLIAPDNFAKFEQNVRSGFYYQYMRNMLHLSNQNGTFSEIGQIAGVSNTDWSWSALLADYDNDGWKDLFISNGYLRDYTNMDFIKYMENYVQQKGRLQREDVLEIIKQMPASNVSNYIFKNTANTSFTDASKAWGIQTPSNSNGAAYADLDNDGDLDLIANNINQPAFIYKNTSEKKSGFLGIDLKGAEKNTQGLGAKVIAYTKSGTQILEKYTARGYLSAVSGMLHFGLGENTKIDSITVIWNSGKSQSIPNPPINKKMVLEEKNANTIYRFETPKAKLVFAEVKSPINYIDPKSNFNDFERQLLLVNQLSYSGPCISKADMDKDGLEDILIGGNKGQSTKIFYQKTGGSFTEKSPAVFAQDTAFVDSDICIFDVNNDGLSDIYISSGGYHNLSKTDALLNDRLYINLGKGEFKKVATPALSGSKSCVRAADINSDGFVDLFVGGNFLPGEYPLSGGSHILINNKKGGFEDKTASICPELKTLSLVKDALWVDLNNDKKPELVLAGEYLPIQVFEIKNNTLENVSDSYLDTKLKGWVNKIASADLNKDGKPDLIIGNLGLNHQLNASPNKPVELIAKDFDSNGSIDGIVSYFIQGKKIPFITRDELQNQLSYQKSKYTNYESYADKGMEELFSSGETEGALKFEANEMASGVFLSQKDGKYKFMSLPKEAQYSPISAIAVLDFNKDGNQDLLLCGNNAYAKIRIGKFDANFGMLFKGNGAGNFEYVSQKQSGFNIWGDIKNIVSINETLYFGINQVPIKAYKLNP
ncbi:VCBS repeat-containing protein [Lacihabitans lacunae]|uniref:VCBS repeat-containing protein n=1 Tax=Lacihabitans lacunae TaxID=1028214 RepID=A0ABV7YPD8_9BACT